MRILLVSTHQADDRDAQSLFRLVNSISDPEAADVTLYVLLQGVSTVTPKYQFNNPRIRTLTTPLRLSLSRARNLILDAVDVSHFDYVLYPDDDCWYPVGFFHWLTSLTSDTRSDVVFVKNDDTPLIPHGLHDARAASVNDVMKRVNSNNIIVSGSIAAQVGPFDERLGLGTAMGGGEDTDYALRAFKTAGSATYVDAPLIGHRSLNGSFDIRVKEMTRYWPGVMLQTLETASFSSISLILYRIAGGLFLVSTGRMPLGRFLLPFRSFKIKNFRDKATTAARYKGAADPNLHRATGASS